MNKKFVIHLMGWPGVGKFTVAKTIKSYDDKFEIFHNHMISDCIFPFVKPEELWADETWKSIMFIKNIVFDFIKTHGRTDMSLIFTGALLEKHDICKNVVKEACDLAENINAIYVPIRLICDSEEIKKRMVSEDRQNHDNKTVDTSVIDRYIEKEFNVLNTEHKNELTIDVTNLKPEEVRDIILQHCDKLG